MYHRFVSRFVQFVIFVALCFGVVILSLPAATSADQQAAIGPPGLSFRYVNSFGITSEPYLTNTELLNRPAGLYTDTANNLFVTTSNGGRVLKYNSAGVNLLAIGKPGVGYTATDIFNYPVDIVVENSGKFWMTDYSRILQRDANGDFLQSLPVEDTWITGTSNDRFEGASGITLDSQNNLFVVDRNNHRVQIYSLGTGSPVYKATLGQTGVTGSDNAHFDSPARIAVDSSDRVYITDNWNHRVQRCAFSGSWSCTTFIGSLQNPSGITIGAGGQIFIGDSGNNRILSCNPAGSCTNYATNIPYWIEDISIDASGNLYASDVDHHVVRKFTGGGPGTIFKGTQDKPYNVENQRINAPHGVAVSSSGDVYVSESRGFRLLKFNAAGVQQWAVGQPGFYGDDNAHFGSYWGGPKDVAISPDNRIYVVDRPNERLKVYSSAGEHLMTFGSYGSGNQEFDVPEGLAFDHQGNLYVADSANQRVQVFDSSHNYLYTLGVTGVAGPDNGHFNSPSSVAVDSQGRIYVADQYNNRIQVFGSNRNYLRTIGETGVYGEDHFHFSNPKDVAVDKYDNVYVADAWNNRVQVYDSSGNYLTTIGGQWGTITSQFQSVYSVAVDQYDNVYITGEWDHRVQKFARGAPGWKQVNINGFGNRYSNIVGALVSFHDKLYAGTYDYNDGGQLWRQEANGSWTQIVDDGFGDSSNLMIDHMLEFKGQLYAGTWNYAENAINGGQIWRSASGNPGSWQKVVDAGFGDTSNEEVFRFIIFKDMIYASTWNYTKGSEIWRSASGDSGSWQQVASGGLGDAHNYVFLSLAEFNGFLFAASYNYEEGTKVWRSASGDSGSWQQVSTIGFGDPFNVTVTLAPFKGYLYAGTDNYYNSPDPGAELWRCRRCDGSDWQQVAIAKGFGETKNRRIDSLIIFQEVLYAVTNNYSFGMQVWKSTNGTTWTKAAGAGFGDANNSGVYWGNATAVSGNNLYIGTINYANGGELWRLVQIQRVFLPVSLNGLKGPTPQTEDIYGRVTNKGQPVKNEEIILRLGNGVDYSDFASTQTDANGQYRFTNLPDLGPNQSYYVRWFNENDSSRLSTWACWAVDAATTNPAAYRCDFDLQNIELIAPEHNATLFLPAAFSWEKRILATDDYEFNIADMNNLFPHWWTDPALGYVSQFTLSGLPTGFAAGKKYGWWVWVYGPDGYGLPYYYRYITFSGGQGSAIENVAARPFRGLKDNAEILAPPRPQP